MAYRPIRSPVGPASTFAQQTAPGGTLATDGCSGIAPVIQVWVRQASGNWRGR